MMQIQIKYDQDDFACCASGYKQQWKELCLFLPAFSTGLCYLYLKACCLSDLDKHPK